MSFIKKRLSRDNFWNLVFWLGMVSCGLVTELVARFFPVLGLIFLILSVTVVPYLLANQNKVVYTEDKVFINKFGNALDCKYPKRLLLVIIVSVFISIQLFFAVDKNIEMLCDSLAVYTAIGLFIPTLYFIILNCPISILFNKNAWQPHITGFDPSTNGGSHKFSSSSPSNGYSSLSSHNYSSDNSYRHLSSNRHYHR